MTREQLKPKKLVELSSDPSNEIKKEIQEKMKPVKKYFLTDNNNKYKYKYKYLPSFSTFRGVSVAFGGGLAQTG